MPRLPRYSPLVLLLVVSVVLTVFGLASVMGSGPVVKAADAAGVVTVEPAAKAQLKMSARAQAQEKRAASRQHAGAAAYYTIQRGDTLSGIASRLCGGASHWRSLWSANRQLHDPGALPAHARLRVQCTGGHRPLPEAPGPAPADQPASSGTGASASGSQQAPTGQHLSQAQIRQLWLSAGGSASAADTAACIGWAESGGNQYATGSAGERGIWQISPDHGPMSTYDLTGNAKAAIQLSGNGTDWSQWTTAASCGA